MVTGDNKGHTYEKRIVKILKDRNLVPRGATGAGSGVGTDIPFLHKNSEYRLEIKNNATDPDYGQKRLVPKLVGKKWVWQWAPGIESEKIVGHYTSLGVLDYLNKKNIVPNKFRIHDCKLSKQQKAEDMTNFEDRKFTVSNKTFIKYYEDKAEYIQVGNGFGFYHLKRDTANIGTKQFDGKFILRFRAKSHNNHWIKCPKCEGVYRPTTSKCSNCQTVLIKPRTKVEVYHDYSFFATLKCTKILSDNKSKYNIEETSDQKFPPIKHQS